MSPRRAPASVRLSRRLYARWLRRLPAPLAPHAAEMRALHDRLAVDAHAERGALGVAHALAGAGLDLLRARLAASGERAAAPPGRVARRLDALRQDSRIALRRLRGSAGFSAGAVLTLAVGIGAATSVFGVVDAVVLRGLPFHEPERLVRLLEITPRGDAFSVSAPNYLDWVRRERSFSHLAAFASGDRTLVRDGEASRVSGLRVTHGFFDVLGWAPELGRLPGPEHDRPGSDTAVVVLSRGFWQRALGADPGCVGDALVIDGREHRVAAVVDTRRSFASVDVFTPLAPDSGGGRDDKDFTAIARLADGVSFERAEADLQRIAAQLAAEHPDDNAGWSARLQSFHDWRVGPRLSRLGSFLLVSAALLLAMACASVAGLVLARSLARQREIAVRTALGARRRRLVAQLVTESGWLSLLGGAGGVALSAAALPLVRAAGPSDVPRLDQAALDPAALAVALAAAVASVLVAGLLPALLATPGDPFGGLRDGFSSGSPSRRRLRGVLVAGQVAVAAILLVGAALLTRSFDALRSVELGLEPDGALQVDLNLAGAGLDIERRPRLVAALEERARAIPGVTAAGTVVGAPFGELMTSNFVAAGDALPADASDFLPVSWRAVTPGYFEALGMRLVRGRALDPGVRPRGHELGRAEVVIDSTLAEALWPGRDPVGQRIAWGEPGGSRLRVVGVVAPVRDERLDADPRPRLYIGYDFFPWPDVSIVLRTGADPAAALAAFRAALPEVRPGLAAGPSAELSDVLVGVLAWPRSGMQALAAFGLVALLLAAVGVYGAIAASVESRTREIGVRMALGATPRGVALLLLGGGLTLAGSGLAGGLGATLALSRLLEGLLYGIPATDPVSFGVAAAAIAAVALLAAGIPASRAARVDPARALRAD